MKLVSLALAGLWTCCLGLTTAPGGESHEETAGETYPAKSSALGTNELSVDAAAPAAFAATITTGNRTRQFDSPARAMSELQRAVWLMRRSGQEDHLAFVAVLTVNGVEHEFSSPDQARTACRAVVDALQRLAKVRASLDDVGIIPAAEPADRSTNGEASDRDADAPRPAMLSVRQRINEALDQEAPRAPGRVLHLKRRQQHVAEPVSRAERQAPEADAAASDRPAGHVDPDALPGAALEARRATEITEVRRMLSRAFSAGERTEVAAARQGEKTAATTPVKADQ